MEIKLIKEEFLSSSGADTIKYSIWQGDGEKKGIINIIHGMCEYIGRYHDFAEYLAKEGYIVCGQNHIGHGESALDDNGLGYFAKKKGYEFLIEDAHKLVNIMKNKYPGLPYAILGHSMGSFIARNYFAKYGKEIDAIIFMGTSGKNPKSFAIKAIAGIQKTFLGPKSKAKLIAKMSSDIYNTKIPNKRTIYDWISTDNAVVDKYAEDKYCTYTFSASAYLDLINLLNLCNKNEWYAQIPKDIPILVISGEEDPIGNYKAGVKEVYEGIKNAGATKVLIKTYPKMRHEVLNEIGKEIVYGDVLEFLKENL